MVKVVVAEKPSVARDLARVLGAKARKDGWIERPGSADSPALKITWTLGHLVELKTPDQYDASLKRWRLDTLPFVPERFELQPRGDKEAKKQLEVVADLCREAEDLVCATDAGREGELIFRYVLSWAGLEERDFQRLWLSSMTDDAIRQAFGSLRPRAEFEALHDAARCRSEADWIVGLNATRYHTVRFGTGRVLWSVGRVQTPVLGLIADRDDEIRAFESAVFWELRTKYRDVMFRRIAGRFEQKELADAELEKVEGEPFEITKVETKRERMPSPFLHDLTSLQRWINQRYGFSAQRTLQLTQDLYERKLVTYPRTDSRHLTKDMVPTIQTTLERLRPVWPTGAPHPADSLVPPWKERLDPSQLPVTKRVFDDSKVTDHHAIVPTGRPPEGLDAERRKVYDEILRRLCQVFLPDRERDVTTVEGQSAGVAFRARGLHVVDPGWSALDEASAGATKKKSTKKKGAKGKDSDDDEEQVLPAFEQGESGPHAPDLHEGKTKAPRPWTEATLLGAMETAGKFVDDDELREAMKARGLGTPATRASILETLIRRGYVERDKKALRVTDLGRVLIAVVADPLLKSPELTGDWEAKLRKIEDGDLDAASFVQEIVDWTKGLCERRASEAVIEDGAFGACPRCGKPVIEGQRAYGCSGWKDGCGFTMPKQWRGAEIRPFHARRLLGTGVLLDPLSLSEPTDGDPGPRVVAMTKTGALLDLEVPSRERQQKGGGGPKSRSRSAPGTKGPAKKKKAAAKSAAKSDEPLQCPRCQSAIVEGERGFGCSAWRSGCKFVVWKVIEGRKTTKANLKTLLSKGKTRALKGFKAPDGSERSGRLVLGDDGVSVEWSE